MNAKAFITTSQINNGNTQVNLEGFLTIRNAAEVKANLLPLLDQSKKLRFVLKNVIKIDLTVLQLLAAFKKSADAKGIQVSFESCLNEPVSSMLDNAGIKTIFTQQ